MRRGTCLLGQNLIHDIQAALEAKPALASSPLEQRQAFLRNLRDDLMRHQDAILRANKHDCEAFAQQHQRTAAAAAAAAPHYPVSMSSSVAAALATAVVEAGLEPTPLRSGRYEKRGGRGAGRGREAGALGMDGGGSSSSSSSSFLDASAETSEASLSPFFSAARYSAYHKRLSPLRLDKLCTVIEYLLKQPDPLEVPDGAWVKDYVGKKKTNASRMASTSSSSSSSFSCATAATSSGDHHDVGSPSGTNVSAGVRTVIVGGGTPDPHIDVCAIPVPLGVVGVLSRYRPRMCLDATAMGILSGNAMLLDGGASVHCTNQALISSVRRALVAAGLPLSAVVYVESYDINQVMSAEWVKLTDRIDLGIVCGPPKLFEFASRHATIPLLRATSQSCSLYVDQSATFDTALEVILNSKYQKSGAANSLTTLIVHEGFPRYAELLLALREQGTVLLGDAAARERAPDCIAELASEEELKGLSSSVRDSTQTLCVRTVSSLEQTFFFLELFGSRQTDGILATDKSAIAEYCARVDSAIVLVNASTRLASGTPLGCGTDLAITTSKIHCRGPLTLPMLVTRKFVVRSKSPGKGAIRRG